MENDIVSVHETHMHAQAAKHIKHELCKWTLAWCVYITVA